MTLQARVLELKQELPKEHQEVAHYVEHALQAIESFEEEHRKFSAAQALSLITSAKPLNRVSTILKISFWTTWSKG